MSRPTDRHFLRGLLALQTGLIRADQLVAALQAWTAEKDRPLDEHLTGLGFLDEPQRRALAALAELQVKAHGGDLERSLGSIPMTSATRAELAAVVHGDFGATRAGSDATTRRGTTTDDDSFQFNGGRSWSGANDVPPTDAGSRFRVIRPLVKGGLGAVYVAMDTELRREVALKQILEDKADNPISRGRFLVEAEITGRLEHPGVVPVYGMGTYGDGRPYYAMRLVRGDTLHDAIEAFHKGPKTGPARSLEFRRLLRKFTDVCNTIEYAHSRGVLHRDIKPANVIVGEHGETLVVDWGLAKALGRAEGDSEDPVLIPFSGEGSSLTVRGQAMGTPAYMSPEQARGDLEKLDRRSDVYSLGATLFHLLTGRAPFQGPGREIVKAIESADPPRPRALEPTLDPALEAVVPRAMAKDPAARYPSAKALADDIDRWLADERVEAHAEPWTRTTIRWLTRHRAGVAAAAAAGLVALVGLVVVSVGQSRANALLAVQRARAEVNESQAISAVKRFKDAIIGNPELRDNPELDSLRKALLKEPLTFFEQLRQRLQADNDARPESLFKLADAAGAHAGLVDAIGDKHDAIRAYRESLQLFEGLTRDHPDVADYQDALATSHNNLGVALQDVGQTDEARTTLERAIAIRRRLVQDHPRIDEYRHGLAASQNNLGVLLRGVGQTDEARTAFERVIEIQAPLADDHPDTAKYQSTLATGHGNLGLLFLELGRTEEARAALERAVEIQQRLVDNHPQIAGLHTKLAELLRHLGATYERETRIDDARLAYGRAVEISEFLVRDRPAVADYQARLASCRIALAGALRGAGKADEAREILDRAIAIQERLVREHPAAVEYQNALAGGYNDLGGALAAAGRDDEARTTFAKAIEVARPLARDHPAVLEYQALLALIHANLAPPLAAAGRIDEARTAYKQAIEIGERLVRDHPAVVDLQTRLADNHIRLGALLTDAGRTDEARAAHRSAAEILGRLARDRPEAVDHGSRFGAILNNMAQADLGAERFAEARERLVEAIAWQKKAVAAHPERADYHQFLQSHLVNLIRAESGLGHEDEAVRLERELAELRIGDPAAQADEARIRALRNGEEPTEPAERLTLAHRAFGTQRYQTAEQLLGDALDADPRLADDRKAQHAYNAACAAALAADDRGLDPADDAEKPRLRARALGWLKAELAIWAKLLDSAQPQDRETVAEILQHWRDDADLTGVRDPDALAKFPEDERTEWAALWESVDELLAKAK